MSPVEASIGLWVAWLISWVAAAFWSRRTQAEPSGKDQIAYRVTSVCGGFLLFFPAGSGFGRRALGGIVQLWRLPLWAAWLCTGFVGVGFLFCWWARVTLGDLWSSSVTRKEAHQVVRGGPYGLVRHPIYTGLLFSALAVAVQIGAAVGFAGAALMALGFWLKARLEERFLASELGRAYDDYRRSTPMLTPFWPVRR